MDLETDVIAILLAALAGGAGVALMGHALLRRFLSTRASAGVLVALGIAGTATGAGSPLLASGVGIVVVGVWLLLAEPPKDDG